MNGSIRRGGRATSRLLWLVGELALGAARFILQSASRDGHSSLARRSLWLHLTARRLTRVLNLKTRFTGPLPPAGLLVCNHLSYVDIVFLASLTPAIFVAKSEVRRWPIFGWFARQGGTIFVQRERRAQTTQANNEVMEALEAGALVVLFPEGTSSDGREVLPFKSSLLEPAARSNRPIYAGLIRYELDDGDVGEEVCYWKDHTLGPHLWNLLGKYEVRADVHFSRVRGASTERKELARQLHREVSALRSAKEEWRITTAKAVTKQTAF